MLTQYVLYALLALAVLGLAVAVVMVGRELNREIVHRHDSSPGTERKVRGASAERE